jgi:hypothetical protein
VGLRLEELEDRSVPTATLGVQGGVLQFVGATTVGDVLGVSYSPSGIYTFRDLTEQIAYNNNPLDNYAYVPAGNFTAISITGGDAPNVFYIDSIAQSLTLNGGASDDTLMIGNDLNGVALNGMSPAITFHGGGGYNTVSASDFSGPAVAHSYALTDSVISRDNVPLVGYDAQTQAVWLNPGMGDNQIRAYSTSATAQTQITMQPTGKDNIIVGDPANTLDAVQGVLVVVGADGSLGRNDNLYLDDLGSANGNSYQVATWGDPAGAATAIDRNGQLLVSAFALRSCVLDTGAGADTVNVVGTAPGTDTTVHTGKGNDDIEVGDPFHGLDYLLGKLTVDGGPGGNTLHINDAAAASGHTYLLQSSEFDRATSNNSVQPIDYHNFRNIEIDLTAFNDLLDVTGTPASSSVTVNMGVGDDTILSTTSNNNFYLNGLNQGYMTCVGGTANFLSAENLEGWTGKNTVHFLEGGSVSGNVTDVVGGNNTLDYSTLTEDVKVDLEKQYAFAIGGIVSGFENVMGGAGNDLLIGDDKPNFLVGGAGNNVIVGGRGLDFLVGGPGNDLIIGGTAFNYDLTDLDAVWLEWTNPDVNDDIPSKISHLLLGGGLNGDVTLSAGNTVISDPVPNNVIIPGGGSNWVWK